MSVYALIKDGSVVNTVVWDGDGDIFGDFIAINIDEIGAGIGWTYDGTEFTAPPALEPDIDQPEMPT